MERSELIHLLSVFSGSAVISQDFENKLARKGLPASKVAEYETKRAAYEMQYLEAREKIIAAFESRNRKKNGKTEA